MDERKETRGQSMLEIAIILPILLILLFGVAEAGFGLRNYLVVVNANREGTRLGSRGRFTEQEIAARVVSSGGVVRREGVDVPFLRTMGPDPNTGIIITRIDLDANGAVLLQSTYISGVIAENGSVRAILQSDSKISATQVLSRQIAATQQINAMREAQDYDKLKNQFVIVETFFLHHPLGRGLVPDPWVMYTHTEMRIVTNRGE